MASDCSKGDRDPAAPTARRAVRGVRLPAPVTPRGGPGAVTSPGGERPSTTALHIWVLVSFAVAQPLYGLLGSQAEFFIFQNAGRAEILGLVLVLSGGLPLALAAAGWLAGLVHPRIGRWFHWGLVLAGVALTVLPLLRSVEAVPGVALVYAALVLGAVAAVCYARFRPVRMWFTWLTPAAVVFPVLFVAFSPVTALVLPAERALGPERVPIGNPAPIVFVVLDEFPTTSLMDGEERIDAERYPSFAALARDATWYRRATTVADTTYDALPAILTGRYPRPEKLPHAIDHPHNLFTLLAGTYEMHTAGALTQLCPEGLCIGDDDGGVSERLPGMLSDLAIVYLHLVLSDDLRALLPPINHAWRDFGRERGEKETRLARLRHAGTAIRRSKDDRRGTGIRFIERIGPAERPGLHFLHLMLPHSSFTYLPSGRTYGANDGMPGMSGKTLETKRQAPDEWNVEQSYQRHLLQVGAVDQWLGELVAHLRGVGLYDESVLVLTADHGVSFRAGDHVRHATRTTFQDILAVPLFIKAPFQSEGRIDDRPTELVDIVPSVAELIETRLPWPVDGRSVFEPGPAPVRETRLHRWPDLEPATFTGLAGAMARAAGRRHALFGSGPWYPELFARGPHRALIGRTSSELPAGEAVGVEVTLDHADTFTEVDAGSGFVPAHITGGVTGVGTDHPPVSLAVAVNGTIEAVTEPWKVPIGGQEGSWSAIVPETAFRIGKNTVEVFLITETAGKVRLSRAVASG